MTRLSNFSALIVFPFLLACQTPAAPSGPPAALPSSVNNQPN